MMTKIIMLFVMLGMLSTVCAEQNLKRLFYTPGERAFIDVKRTVVKKIKATSKTVPLEQTQRIEVKGFLKRKGKPDVVWVNSKNTLKSNKPLSDVRVIKVQANGKVKIKVRDKGIVRLKPGQVITRQQRPIQESYERKK